MKNFLLLMATFCMATSGYSQILQLGKVSIEELSRKEHPDDPSAVAAILFEKGEVTYDYNQGTGFTMTTTVKTRIKIYKKEGYEYATNVIRYYNDGSTRELVRVSDAATYNLVDGKIVKTKLKSDGEFDEKASKYWSRKKITMPAIQEGSVVEYQYSLTTPLLSRMEDWNFQTDIPIDYSEYKTSIPEYFIYKPNMVGYHPVSVSNSKVTRSIVTTSSERSSGYVSSTSFSQDKTDYVENQTIYKAEHVPAMHEENFVNNMNNYRTAVSHELSATQFPNSPMKTYSTDWESLVKNIYENDDFGAELNKTGYFEADINALIAGKNNQNEKIALIFNYVKSNMNWNTYTGYSCDDGVRKAYKEKTGNVAEINLMLTAMLRYAGISASPVILSTRSNGIAFFPNRSAFNYVIAAVEIQDGLILLDATDKFAAPGVLPTRDLNWFGRLIRKDGTSTDVDLLPKAPSRESVSVMYAINADGSVSGKLRKQMTDNLALSYRDNILSIKEDTYLESMENKYGKIEVSEYKRDNADDISKPIVENYNFRKNDACDIIGDKIYIRPLLFLGDTENPFKLEKRQYPVDFSFPVEFKYNINVEIPAGYVVETFPASASIAMADNVCGFKYLSAVNGNKLQVTCTFSINEAIVGPEQYETLKSFFQKAVEKQTEKLVLKKA